MLEIEEKQDSPEKIASTTGKPTKYFLFAWEFNAIITFINNLFNAVNNKGLQETTDVNSETSNTITVAGEDNLGNHIETRLGKRYFAINKTSNSNADSVDLLAEVDADSSWDLRFKFLKYISGISTTIRIGVSNVSGSKEINFEHPNKPSGTYTYAMLDDLSGSSSYKGDWNASTNSPALVNGTGTLGDEYKVSTSGYMLSKIWIKGDIVFYDGANWIRKHSGINPLIHFPKYREITIGPLGMSNFGLYAFESGTIANYVYTSTYSGFADNLDNFRELKTSASSGSIAKLSDAANGYIPTSINYDVGFYYSFRFHEKTPNVEGRFYMGLTYVNASGSMGNTNPSSYIYGALGVGLDSGDTNYQLFTRETTSASVVKYDTGIAKGSNDIFEATFIRFKNATTVIFILKNHRTGVAYVKEFTYTDGVGRKTIDFNLNNSTSSSAYGIGYSFIKMLTT